MSFIFKSLIPNANSPHRRTRLAGLSMALLSLSLQGCLGGNSNELTPQALQLTHVPDAWAITKGQGGRVAILSTGIDLAHPDLPVAAAARAFGGTDATNVQDGNGRGTHLAGVVFAQHNNKGIKGIAPNADMLIGKVLADNGSGSFSAVLDGLQWAVTEGAHIILLDIGGNTHYAVLQDAIDAAAAAGVLVIVPSGDYGTTTPFYPAHYSSVQSIGAADEQKARWYSSNYGETLSMLAPGQRVLTTAPVGTGRLSKLLQNNREIESLLITGTRLASVTGNVFYCGDASGTAGNTCPDDVAGHIAHVRRGTISMHDKALHAEAKGAVGLIISNNAPGKLEARFNDERTLVAVTISQADGDALQAQTQANVTVSVSAGDLIQVSSTSFAAAHATGVAALMKSADAQLSAGSIRQLMESTAEDLGTPGFDADSGHGLIDAARAVQAAAAP